MLATAAVRYGAMTNIGVFKITADPSTLKVGDKCVIRTERGVETGELVGKIGKSDIDSEKTLLGEILRKTTKEDLKIMDEIAEEKVTAEYKFCQKKIREYKLPMKLADVEHLFGGDKIIFYFLAEGRVDFRQLVKDLAREYQTRIEMKQIGVRDEARLLGHHEHCGRELCCRQFLKNLEPVSMRMAKSQKTTMDPTKISGRCGRLMCCLRFEDEMYRELKAQLPKKGTRVKSEKATGEVIGYDIIKQMVTIETDNGRRVTVSSNEVTEAKPESKDDKPQKKNSGKKREQNVRKESKRRKNHRGNSKNG